MNSYQRRKQEISDLQKQVSDLTGRLRTNPINIQYMPYKNSFMVLIKDTTDFTSLYGEGVTVAKAVINAVENYKTGGAAK